MNSWSQPIKRTSEIGMTEFIASMGHSGWIYVRVGKKEGGRDKES